MLVYALLKMLQLKVVEIDVFTIVNDQSNLYVRSIYSHTAAARPCTDSAEEVRARVK